MQINSLFPRKAIIGVIHLLPLPGAPRFSGNLREITERALLEASEYEQAGIDGIILENFNDDPFSTKAITKEQFALMASIAGQVRSEVSIPLGINVHFNDWESELAICYASAAQFVRIEVYVDTVVTASGVVEPCCAEVTRYRKALAAEDGIAILADIHPKYSRLVFDTPLSVSAQMATNALADGIVVTGATTGVETPIEDVRLVKESSNLPVFIGSGTKASNIQASLGLADGAIVGSAFKEGGDVRNPLSRERLNEFMQVVKDLR